VLEYGDDWVYSIAVNPAAPHMVLAAVHTRGPLISSSYGARGTWIPSSPPPLGSDALVRWKKGRAAAFSTAGLGFYTSWHDGMVSYSTNGGSNWLLASGLGEAHIYPNGISVKPGEPNKVYLADHSHNYDAYNILKPGGVLRSTNSGQSYTTIRSGSLYYSVAALGGAGDTVLAGTYNEGLYKTDNGGTSWQRSVQGLLNSRVTGMVFTGGGEAYASTTTGGGVFRSTNGGLTWAEFNANLSDGQINGLVRHPTNPKILFALTTSAGLRRIDLSGGSAWSISAELDLLPASPSAQTSGVLLEEGDVPNDELPRVDLPALYGVQPPEDGDIFTPGDEALALAASVVVAGNAPMLSMAFAPSNANMAYLGTSGAGVYASSDGGTSWSYTGLPGGTARGLAVSPSNPNRVYAATSSKGRLMISNDGGKNWFNANLPDSAVEVYSVAAAPADPGAAYVGTSNGVYRYNGSAWNHTGLGGSMVTALAYHPALPDRLYAASNWGAYSTIIGQSGWNLLDPALNGVSAVSINFDPADPRRVYVGTEVRGTLRIALWN
jgi:photosystem II stability/assembly factor-like uncharacterized protein